MKKAYEKQDKALDRLEKRYEKELIRNYQLALKEIRAKISEAYARHGDTWEDMNRGQRLANLEREISKEIGKLTSKSARTLKRGVGDMYEESFYRTGMLLSNEVKADLGFSLLAKESVEAALDNPLDRVGFLQRNRDNQARLTRQLREQLTQGLILGEGYSKTAKRIKERMDVGASNVIRIVQTETNRTRNQGKLDGMYEARNAGVEIKKQWLTAGDDRVRDSHEELDGQTFELEDKFEKGSTGSLADAPGHFGVAAEDINCRCTMISVVEGFEPVKRRVRGVGVTDYKSIKEFKDNLRG